MIEPKKPINPGIKHVEFLDIPLKEIDAGRFKNAARKLENDSKNVSNIVNIIKDGFYEPMYHVPPTVMKNEKGRYELITGFHRYTAHRAPDVRAKTLWCSVIEPFEYKGKSARYWLSNWRSNENDPSNKEFKVPRTNDDLVHTLCNMIVDKDIEGTRDGIEAALSDLNVKGKDKQSVLNQVLQRNGLQSEIIAKHTPNIMLETKESFIEENDLETSQVFSKSFDSAGNGDPSQEMRLIWESLHAIENGHTDIHCIAQVSGKGAVPNKIDEIRNTKQDAIQYRWDRMLKIFKDVIENDIDVKFNVHFVRQMQSDSDVLEHVSEE